MGGGITLLLAAGAVFARWTTTRGPPAAAIVAPSPAATSPPAMTALSSPAAPLPFSVRFAVGPMVGQSDLAFRLLTRAHGATVAYTPMLYAAAFRDEHYRRAAIDFDVERYPSAALDRPLIVQFAANDPEELLFAAQHVQHLCDAIDINLGCPQERARDGHYGSYLLARRDWPLVERMVRTLRAHLSVPVTCKIRLLSSFEETLEFCLMLQAAGCAAIAVHGRQRGSTKRRRVGLADLDQIARLKQALAVQVISNGNIRNFADAAANLQRTACDGVMSAEGVLANPRLFSGETSTASCVDLAHEYLSYCSQHSSPPLHWMSDHVNNICRAAIQTHQLLDLRARLKQLGRESSTMVQGAAHHSQPDAEAREGIARLRSFVDELGHRVRQAEESLAANAPFGQHPRHRARRERKLVAEQAAAENDPDDLQAFFEQ